MQKYWKYLRYLLKHKWYVYQQCCRMDITWLGLVHDISKFRPSEFIPYARFFYGEYPSVHEVFGDQRSLLLSRRCKFKEDIKADFDRAWLLHQKRNPHHWQWWVLQNDKDGVICLEMDSEYLVEMVCDWKGAGMAINGRNDLNHFWNENSNKILLHEKTRRGVENLIQIMKI